MKKLLTNLTALLFVFAIVPMANSHVPGMFQPLLTAAAPPPVIGVPQSLGTGGAAPSCPSGTLTTTANILSGDLVIVSVGEANNSAIVSTISDGTNSYTRAVTTLHGVARGEIWYKANAAAVASGATITVTMSATATSCNIQAARVSGIIPSSPLDAAPAGNNTATTTPTVASGTLAQANEILFGALWDALGTTATESSGFTTITLQNATGVEGTTMLLSYKIVAATTTVTYAPTIGTGTLQVTNLVSFKGF